MDTVARIALLCLMAIAALYLSCRSKKYHTTCNLVFLLIAVLVTVFCERLIDQILLAVGVFLLLFVFEKVLFFLTGSEKNTGTHRAKGVKKNTAS